MDNNKICHKLDTDELSKKFDKFLEYETPQKMTWCGGCGNYGILNALEYSFVLENIQPNQVLMCFDVGCNGNASDKIRCNTLHGLHGRVISLASGAALANTHMKVVATAGDGATFSEGINHLVHAIRNDYPITFIHHDNQNYGLTTGQASATTKKGFPMNASPDGVLGDPINPVDLVLSLNPSFVARTFSGDIEHMTSTFREALNHKGFSFVEVLQACPTYNKATPQEWYYDRIKYIENLKGYDNTDIWQARKIAADLEKDIYLGVIYKNKNSVDFMSRIESRKTVKTTLVEEVMIYHLDKFLDELS